MLSPPVVASLRVRRDCRILLLCHADLQEIGDSEQRVDARSSNRIEVQSTRSGRQHPGGDPELEAFWNLHQEGAPFFLGSVQDLQLTSVERMKGVVNGYCRRAGILSVGPSIHTFTRRRLWRCWKIDRGDPRHITERRGEEAVS